LKLAALFAAALVAGSAVRVWNAGQPQVNAAHNPAVQLAGSQGYLIPYDPSVIGQWNATDLNNGTSRVGATWSRAGTVPFNGATSTQPPSVGSFSDSNYFSQPDTSPIDFATPFTITIIASPTSDSNNPILFGGGVFTTNGYYIQVESNGKAQLTLFGGAGANGSTSNTITLGAISTILFGWDGSKGWVQLNGGAAVSFSQASYLKGTTNLRIGNYVSLASYYLTGTIFEIQARAEAPSAALFTAIYQSVEANL
jgi:hypothetical protein